MHEGQKQSRAESCYSAVWYSNVSFQLLQKMDEHYPAMEIKGLQNQHIDVTKLQGSFWFNQKIWSVYSFKYHGSSSLIHQFEKSVMRKQGMGSLKAAHMINRFSIRAILSEYSGRPQFFPKLWMYKFCIYQVGHTLLFGVAVSNFCF